MTDAKLLSVTPDGRPAMLVTMKGDDMDRWTDANRDGIEEAIVRHVYPMVYKPGVVEMMTEEWAAADKAVDEHLTTHGHINAEELGRVVIAAVGHGDPCPPSS